MNWVIPTKALEARNSACSASYSTTKERFLARASSVALRSSETSQWAQISVAIIPYILKHANWSSTTIFNNQAFFFPKSVENCRSSPFQDTMTDDWWCPTSLKTWHTQKSFNIFLGSNELLLWLMNSQWLKITIKISQTSFAIFRFTKNALNSFLVNKVICHSFSRSEQNETKIFSKLQY